MSFVPFLFNSDWNRRWRVYKKMGRWEDGCWFQFAGIYTRTLSSICYVRAGHEWLILEVIFLLSKILDCCMGNSVEKLYLSFSQTKCFDRSLNTLEHISKHKLFVFRSGYITHQSFSLQIWAEPWFSINWILRNCCCFVNFGFMHFEQTIQMWYFRLNVWLGWEMSTFVWMFSRTRNNALYL